MDTRLIMVRSLRMVVMVFFAVGCMLAGACSWAVDQGGHRPYRTHAEVIEEDIAASDERYSAEEFESMGDGGFKRGNLEHAFLNYEKALRLKPKNQNLRCKRAWVLLAGNFNDEAAKEFETVLSKNENSAAAREGLGQAYFQMKRYDQALAEFEKALIIDATRWRSRNYVGIMYNHKNNPLRAIQEFTSAIAIKPDSGILYNNLGMAYNLAGRYSEALDAYQKAYELGAPREKTLNNLGIVLAKMGRIVKAEDVFMEVGDEAQAYNNLGCVYLSAGDYEMARKSFETALRISPEPYSRASENLKKCRRMMN